MATFLLVIHLIVSLFLIVIVLIQGGKGAEMGAAFGGSSQTLFGARGAATFFSKLTTVSAVVFMLTSLLLAIATGKGTSVVSEIPVNKQQQGTIPQGATGPVQGTQQTPPLPAQSGQPVQQTAPAAPAK